MKPAPFGYERPRELKALLSVLAEANGSARIIAGGQSLGPMLNLRLVQPELIVDITALTELKQAERSDDELVLGYRDAVARRASVLHGVGDRVSGHEFHRTAVIPRARLHARRLRRQRGLSRRTFRARPSVPSAS